MKISILIIAFLALFSPSKGQNLEVQLGDSLSLLIRNLNTERNLLGIDYSREIHPELNTVDIEVNKLPDDAVFGGMQLLYKNFTFYKLRLEKVFLVLSKKNNNIDIASNLISKYGKPKVHNTYGYVWVLEDKIIFLSQNEATYSLTYADKQLYYEAKKDAAVDL